MKPGTKIQLTGIETEATVLFSERAVGFQPKLFTVRTAAGRVLRVRRSEFQVL